MSAFSVAEILRLVEAEGAVARPDLAAEGGEVSFAVGEAGGPRLEFGNDRSSAGDGFPWATLSFPLSHPAVRALATLEGKGSAAQIDFAESDELVRDAVRAALQHIAAAAAVVERPSPMPSLARRGSDLLAEIEGARRSTKTLPGPLAPIAPLTRPVAAASAIAHAELVEAARAARLNAWAPYSRYAVGAAIRTVDGRIFAGANVENASYGLSVCAERSAVVAAVSAGVRKIVAVAVVTSSSPPAAPCGVCRQTLAEFCADDLPVTLGNDRGESVTTTLGELLPRAFRGDALT